MFNIRQPDFQKNLNERQSYLVIFSLLLLNGILLIIGASRILFFIFPLTTIAVGILLYFRSPGLYVGFTWWIWFIASFIFRLIEYQNNDITPGSNGALLASIVTLISAVTLIKHLPRVYNHQALPFLLCFGSIVYGFMIGVIKNHTFGGIYSTIQMISPIFFGLHLYINWKDYPIYSKIIQKTFSWGMLILSLYGIYQFISFPEWDKFNIINNGVSGQINNQNSLITGIFSTTDGRQQFSGLLIAGLLLLFSSQNKFTDLFVQILGFLALLLTQARAGWLGFVIGLIFFVFSLRNSQQIRTILIVTSVITFVIFIGFIEPFSTVIWNRLSSFSDPISDYSFNARANAYNELMGRSMLQFIGSGIGFSVSKISIISDYDGSIFQMLFYLGWIGISFLISGISVILWKIYRPEGIRYDVFSQVSRAIILGILAQIGFNLIFIGPLAMVLWGFIGISLSSRSYFINGSNI